LLGSPRISPRLAPFTDASDNGSVLWSLPGPVIQSWKSKSNFPIPPFLTDRLQEAELAQKLPIGVMTTPEHFP
jgi:hypothetical protein